MLSMDTNSCCGASSNTSSSSSKSTGWKQHLGCVHQKDAANEPVDQLQPTRGKNIKLEIKPYGFAKMRLFSPFLSLFYPDIFVQVVDGSLVSTLSLDRQSRFEFLDSFR